MAQLKIIGMIAQRIPLLGKQLLVLGLLYLIFRWVEFSAWQSTVLSYLGMWSYFKIDELTKSSTKPTPPRLARYIVSIGPDWDLIFNDLGVSCSKEEWATIWEYIGATPKNEYDLIRDGMTFTILEQTQNNPVQTLAWSYDHRRFTGKVDFEESVKAIVFVYKTESVALAPTYSDEHLGRNRVLRFGVKRGDEGYDLSLNVPRWWWEKYEGPFKKNADAAGAGPGRRVTRVREDYNTGSVYVPLATIPYCEFDAYWEPEDFDQQAADKERKRADEARTRFGWNEEKPSGPPEILDIPSPDVIKHKYFRVFHQAI